MILEIKNYVDRNLKTFNIIFALWIMDNG